MPPFEANFKKNDPERCLEDDWKDAPVWRWKSVIEEPFEEIEERCWRWLMDGHGYTRIYGDIA